MLKDTPCPYCIVLDSFGFFEVAIGHIVLLLFQRNAYAVLASPFEEGCRMPYPGFWLLPDMIFFCLSQSLPRTWHPLQKSVARITSYLWVHITYRLSLQLLQAVINLYPDSFQLKSPPYEYEFEKIPMDLILGDREIRKKICNNESMEDIEKSWLKDLEGFKTISRNFYLY